MNQLERIETVKSGIAIPVGQSIFSGLFAAGAVGGLAALFHAPDPGLMALTGAGVVSCLHWFGVQSRWQAARAYALYGELPPEPEPMPEEPRPTPQAVRVELVQDGGRHVKFLELPASVDQLVALAAGVSTGSSLAVNLWTGSGKPFSRSEFENLRAALLKAGLAREGRPNVGMELTAAGRSVFRRFSPTLLAGKAENAR